MMRVVCSVGGGFSSTILMPLKLVEQYGDANVDLIMAALPNEHPDVWRLVAEAERLTGLKVKMIGTGETPMQVFQRLGFLGNTRADPCSLQLKREVIAAYILEHYDPANTLMAVGITAHENTRIDRRIAILANWERKGWQAIFPLEDDQSLTHERQLELCKELVGWIPEMYLLGFPHHNCHGACVKAGKQQWAMLLWHYPKVYAEWEQGEESIRAVKGNVTILRDEFSKVQTDGTLKRWSVPLSLCEFRERMQSKWAMLLPGFDPFDGLDETPSCAYCGAM